jgi:predicted  nucleic acid-binding Zn-ribbon protein
MSRKRRDETEVPEPEVPQASAEALAVAPETTPEDLMPLADADEGLRRIEKALAVFADAGKMIRAARYAQSRTATLEKDVARLQQQAEDARQRIARADEASVALADQRRLSQTRMSDDLTAAIQRKRDELSALDRELADKRRSHQAEMDQRRADVAAMERQRKAHEIAARAAKETFDRVTAPDPEPAQA